MARLLALLGLILLPACATVTSGTSQNVSVITDPPGATCQIMRGGSVVGVVNPTPGTVNISKSGQALAVNCTRAGSLSAVHSVSAEFQAMTVGNLLLGGIIGVAVDAASGAMSRYPDTVTITLPPERFASAPARDAFFATRQADTRRSFGERIATARGHCGSTDATCPAAAQLEAERDVELARLEAQRLAAGVDG